MIEINGPKMAFFDFKMDGEEKCIWYFSIKLLGANPVELAHAFDRKLSIIKNSYSDNPQAVLFWRAKPEINAHYDENDIPTGMFKLSARIGVWPELSSAASDKLDLDPDN